MTNIELFALIYLSLCILLILASKHTKIKNFFINLRIKYREVRHVLTSSKCDSTNEKQSEHINEQFSSSLSSLAPSNQADKDGNYSKALKWALNKSDIFNVALTGPYGSGKTSVLRTFFENNKEFKSLNVSLAKFSKPDLDDAEQDQGDDDYADDDRGFLLEKSIIQQILYTETKQSLPNSRFERISHFSFTNKVFIALLTTFIFMLGFTYIFEREWFISIFSVVHKLSIIPVVVFYLLLVTLILCGVILLVGYLKNRSIDTVNLFTGDFKLAEQQGASALNIHLDELIYFFEVTDYSVVIFEDIDRFLNTSIFTKLREINLLINNSKQVNKPPTCWSKTLNLWNKLFNRNSGTKKSVKFIYAVKDDLFSDATDRTKFFDYILPIIPYVSRENSKVLLLERLSASKKLSHETYSSDSWKPFIKDITFYIDDMRLLLNICNEFSVYQAKLLDDFEKPDAKKLLAFVLYKNKYPKDFSKLYIGESCLSKVFINKRHSINEAIQLIEAKINALDETVESSEKEVLNSLEELRELVIARIVKSERATNRLMFLSLKGTNHDVSELLNSDEIFNQLLDENVVTLHKNGRENNIRLDLLNQEFGVADWKKEYEVRCQYIKNKGKVARAKINEELVRLKNKQKNLRLYSLTDLLLDKEFELISIELMDNLSGLQKLLLKKGYIDENYSHYLNYLHNGELSKSDKDFVFSVKEDNALPYETTLLNVEAVLEELDESDFKTASILNFQLLEHLLEADPKDMRLQHVYAMLKNNFKSYSRFISDYTSFYNSSDEFLIGLAKVWSNLWLAFCSSLSDEHKKRHITNILISNLTIDELVKLNINGVLEQYLTFDLKVFTDFEKISLSRIEELIKKFEMVFTELAEFLNLYPQSLKIILKKHAFKINATNLLCIAKELKIKSNNKFPNFNELTSADLDLQIYFKSNLTEFLEDYAFEVPIYIEDESNIIDFLSDTEVSVDTKITLIEKAQFEVQELSIAIDSNFWQYLFAHNRVSATWANVFKLFKNELSFESHLISFIERNIDQLLVDVIKGDLIEELEFDEDMSEFFFPLVHCKELSDDVVENVLSKNDCYISNISFKEMTDDRVKMLIEHGDVALSIDNLERLRGSKKSFVVTLVEKFIDEYSENSDSAPRLNLDELVELTHSLSISGKNKAELLNYHLDELSSASLKEVNDIVSNLLDIENLELSFDIIILLLKALGDYESKLQLFSNQIDKLSHTLISDCFDAIELNNIPITYKAGTNTAVEKSKISNALLDQLKSQNYVSSIRTNKDKYRLYFYNK
jgi:antiviral immunity YobI-like NTPase